MSSNKFDDDLQAAVLGIVRDFGPRKSVPPDVQRDVLRGVFMGMVLAQDNAAKAAKIFLDADAEAKRRDGQRLPKQLRKVCRAIVKASQEIEEITKSCGDEPTDAELAEFQQDVEGLVERLKNHFSHSEPEVEFTTFMRA